MKKTILTIVAVSALAISLKANILGGFNDLKSTYYTDGDLNKTSCKKMIISYFKVEREFILQYKAKESVLFESAILLDLGAEIVKRCDILEPQKKYLKDNMRMVYDLMEEK